jgi:osmoprotectant transport system ATP-binding protein
VRKRFGDVLALDRLSLTVERGEVLSLVGGSGSGKSTALKLVNRLVDADEGDVLVDGASVRDADVVSLRRGIGYVFQRLGLFPHWTVGENIAATPTLLRWKSSRISSRTDELLELVGLDPVTIRGRFAHELSGGQAQRVAVARALAAEPAIVLLDEPFGALDPITRANVQERFAEIQRALGFTAVFVTHDVAEAVALGHRVAVLRDGALVQIGAPHELYAQPADAYVAAMMRAPLEHADALREKIQGGAR